MHGQEADGMGRVLVGFGLEQAAEDIPNVLWCRTGFLLPRLLGSASAVSVSSISHSLALACSGESLPITGTSRNGSGIGMSQCSVWGYGPAIQT